MMNVVAVEAHPLAPFFPEGATLLMLGSFPPTRNRWTMDFFYPNFQNDMWRIFGHIFFNNKDHFISPNKRAFLEAEIRQFLEDRKIALWDTVMEARRLKENASDKFLEAVRPIDIEAVINKLPACRAIAVMGQKAIDTLQSVVSMPVAPAVGQCAPVEIGGRTLSVYRMPSSSRAYPKTIEEKAEAYAKMFFDLNI